MAIKQVKSVAEIPSSELDDWGPVPEPVSETVSQLRGRIINENPDGSEAGIWECLCCIHFISLVVWSPLNFGDFLTTSANAQGSTDRSLAPAPGSGPS